MKKYQITDPKYYSRNPNKFINITARSLRERKSDYIVLRDKKATKIEKIRVLKKLVALSKRLGFKLLINEDIALAKRFRVGVHLTSKQFSEISKCKREKLFVVVSTHTPKEFETAIKKGADLATFSPIFETLGKGAPKGVKSLNLINDKIKSKLIALGGVTSQAHIDLLRGSNIRGFASIRYFV